MKARIFNICQYKNNPDTKELLLNAEQIKYALKRYSSIKKYAYILHDKDVFLEDNDKHHEGDTKPPHWHIVIQSDTPLEVNTVAKWFGIQPQYIGVPKGVGAGKFLDCVRYLTHEDEKQRELGKHLYSDNEIHANFDFRALIDARENNKIKYGRDLSEKEQILFDVMYNGMTLHEVEKKDPFVYMENVDKLLKFRLDYIRRMKPPKTRINFYIFGKGGVGKDLMSRSLARAMFPDIEEDEDIFFTVGAGNVTFEGYDGQPVIIWSDRRSLQLVKTLGGKENFFNVFDTHPTKQRQNVKGSSIQLCNVVNIINGQEDYNEFLDNIVRIKNADGEWVIGEDRTQSYRRFPIIIPLRDDDFDILINKGFLHGRRDLFTEYEAYNNVRGNMAKLAKMCGGENEQHRQLSTQVLGAVTDKYAEVVKADAKEQTDEIADILKKEGWGNQVYKGSGEILKGRSYFEDGIPTDIFI